MSTATRLPEKCRVYLDNTLLPERADGTGLPVPLSPFTIEWGVSAPWDAAVPAVLKIVFIDPDGDYSRVYTTLAGLDRKRHRQRPQPGEILHVRRHHNRRADTRRRRRT